VRLTSPTGILLMLGKIRGSAANMLDIGGDAGSPSDVHSSALWHAIVWLTNMWPVSTCCAVAPPLLKCSVVSCNALVM
jgi:hypothetical protein